MPEPVDTNSPVSLWKNARGDKYFLFHDATTQMMAWRRSKPPETGISHLQVFKSAVVAGAPSRNAVPVLVFPERVRLRLQAAMTTAYGGTPCSVVRLHPHPEETVVGGLHFKADDGDEDDRELWEGMVFLPKSLTFLVGQGGATFVTVVVSALAADSALLGDGMFPIKSRQVRVSTDVDPKGLLAVATNRLGRMRQDARLGSARDLIATHAMRSPIGIAGSAPDAALESVVHLLPPSISKRSADNAPVTVKTKLARVFPGAVGRMRLKARKPFKGTRTAEEGDGSVNDDTETHRVMLRVAPGTLVKLSDVHMEAKQRASGLELSVDLSTSLTPTPMQVVDGETVSPWTYPLSHGVARAVRSVLRPAEEGSVAVRWGYVERSKPAASAPTVDIRDGGAIAGWAAFVHQACLAPGSVPAPANATVTVTGAKVDKSVTGVA